eukprot:Pgem_evm3s555
MSRPPNFRVDNNQSQIRDDSLKNNEYDYIYSEFNEYVDIRIRRKVEKKIYQKDFDLGTLDITEPGIYKLEEDIVFRPTNNPENTTRIVDPAFALGWFTAIRIMCDCVILDFQGHSIEQSDEFNLKQRFFNHITLGSRDVRTQYIKILNGKFGQTSQHGIQGNNCRYLVLENLEFYNYEMAAIGLNGCSHTILKNININQNKQDVVVNGKFAQSLVAIKVAKEIMKVESEAFLMKNNVKMLGQGLIDELENIVTVRPVTDLPTWLKTVNSTDLGDFQATFDGTSYGIILDTEGPMLNGFQTTYIKDKGNFSIFLQNINISSIKSTPREIANWAGQDDNTINKDIIGGVIDYFNGNSDTDKYTGSPLSDLQIFIEKNKQYLLNKINTSQGHISPIFHEWVTGNLLQEKSLLSSIKNFSNRDNMSNIGKILTAIFISSGQDITLRNIVIDSIKNKSISTDDMSNVTGLCIAGSNRISIYNTVVGNIVSNKGNSCAIKLVGDGNICFSKLYHMGFSTKRHNPRLIPLDKDNFNGKFSKHV